MAPVVITAIKKFLKVQIEQKSLFQLSHVVFIKYIIQDQKKQIDKMFSLIQWQ